MHKMENKYFNKNCIFSIIGTLCFILVITTIYLIKPHQPVVEIQEFEVPTYTSYSMQRSIDINVEEPILADTPAIPKLYSPQHSDISTSKKSNTIIDYSNITNGYVMIHSTNNSDIKIKAQIHGPSTTVYTYDVPFSQWVTFPLSDGNGEYTITVLKNITGNKYATINTIKFTVTLEDEFAPFLYSNQYVDYDCANDTILTAKHLIGDETDTIKQIEIIYDYVVNNFTYDYEKAQNIKSNYLPVLDDVLAEKKGICFDYASLMAGMLRSQGVPCKLVTGYVGTAYHAWISVYSNELGWINGAIYFDGEAWNRLDPTFASSGHNSQAILDYINNDNNYFVKRLY